MTATRRPANTTKAPVGSGVDRIRTQPPVATQFIYNRHAQPTSRGAPCLDFPPGGGHRGYADVVDGSGLIVACCCPTRWVAGARLFGRCQATTGIAPFGRLVEQVMESEPCASAMRVFWVVDNGSSHRGQASIDRLEGDWPTLRLVHLLVHLPAQGPIPHGFADLDEVEHRLLGFQRRDEQTAVPFAWCFTRADLERLLHRLAGEERLLAVA
jgi:hypothetical protein